MDAFHCRASDGWTLYWFLPGRFVRLLVILLFAVMLGISLLAPGVGAETSSPEADDAPMLAYTSWRLASLQTAGTNASVPDDPAAFSLVFGEGDAVTVTTACATATGTIAVGEDHAVVPNVVVDAGSTCERRSLPERFVNLLNLSASWAFDDDGGLVLMLMDGGEIRLAQDLVGTTWRWTGFQGGDDSSVTPDAAVTLTFRTDGMVHVAADCVAGDLPYTREGASGLTIDVSGLDVVACAEGTPTARLVGDLGFMRSFVFRNGELFVSLMADGGIHAFVASAPVG